jgi:trigger factor
MQVSIESTGTLERRMEVQVPAEQIEKAVDERLQKISRTVRLKGFRPGKVPVKVVRQQFGQQVRQEVLGDVVQSSFAEAVVQEKLTPAGGPRIEPLNVDGKGGLKYRAVFEVVPQIQLVPLEQLNVSRPVASVDPADVDAMIQNLREQRPTFVNVDREARDTDRVTVDFDGTVDGQAFEGGKGENIAIVLGAGRMLAEFETGLKGVRAGEQKTIELTFPQNYPVATLAGKQARFAVSVKTVEERQLPELDDAFSKSYGVEEGGIERLKEEVEENMKRELADAIRANLKKQVMDGLLAANPLELPKTMVDTQVRDLQIDAARRMGAQDASQIPPPDAFQEPARRRVALTLLVGEVIKNANLQVDQAKVQTRFEELAQQYPDAAQAMQQYRTNPQMRRQMEAAVLEDQVVDWIVERARITEKPSTFKELMNFGA